MYSSEINTSYLEKEKTNNQPSDCFFIFKINELRLDQSAPDNSSPLCIERKKANQTYYTMNPFTWKLSKYKFCQKSSFIRSRSKLKNKKYQPWTVFSLFKKIKFCLAQKCTDPHTKLNPLINNL